MYVYQIDELISIEYVFISVDLYFLLIANQAYKPYNRDTARHIDNADPPQFANLANDENLSTCSETGNENTTRNTNPWWKIWFPKNITFKQLTILTRTDKLGNKLYIL